MTSHCYKKKKRGIKHPHQDSQTPFPIKTSYKEQQVGAFKFPPVLHSLEMPFRYAKSLQHTLEYSVYTFPGSAL